jgi:hypothetical protein
VEWYGWVIVAVVWMSFGLITLYLDYQAQTDKHHQDSLGYEQLFTSLAAGPLGIPFKLVSIRRSEQRRAARRHHR